MVAHEKNYGNPDTPHHPLPMTPTPTQPNPLTPSLISTPNGYLLNEYT